MNRKYVIFCLVLILGVSAFFRLWNLGSNPPSIFRDEAEKGYTAWSLSRTGGYFYFDRFPAQTELKLKKLPLFINVLGVYTSALYQYLATPFVALGGLNEWTVRLPAAFAGILTVLLVYFLVFLGTGNRLAGILSAFFLAISPWHILFSRWALQGILLPLFITLGFLFFLLGIYKKPKALCLSGLFFGLGFYCYAIGRLFIPLFLVFIFLCYRKEIRKQKKWCIPGAVIFLGIAVPVFLYYITGDRAARFSHISIFQESSLFRSVLLFLGNYLKHYSPGFLFLFGDEQLRHSLLGMGMMYFFEAPLLLYGLWFLLQERKPFHLLLLIWFFLFPIPASLTREGIPHALRSITALPLVSIICGLAVFHFYEKLLQYIKNDNTQKRLIMKIVLVFIPVVIVLNVFQMAQNLFFKYPADSSFDWQYGIKQALQYIHEQNIPPEKVYISGYITYAPYLVMFYDKIPPEKLREQGLEALEYRFLPPGISMAGFWNKLPGGAYAILYPGELRGVKPAFVVYHPSRSSRYNKPPVPALQVFQK